MSADPECPARGKECPGFGRKVRFRISCSKANRRQLSDRTDPPHERVRLVHVNVDSDNKTEKKELRVMIQSNHSSASRERETKVLVDINGMKVVAVINSGCSVTTVNANTYAYLIGRSVL